MLRDAREPHRAEGDRARLVALLSPAPVRSFPPKGAAMAASSDGGRRSSIIRPFALSAGATLVLVTVALASAGSLAFWQAWAYGAISLALNVGQRLVLRDAPTLAEERSKLGANGRSSDKVLLAVGLLLTLAMLAAAGLQFRWAGGPSLPLAWFAAGVLLSVAGGLLFLRSLRENAFFSAVVRLQRDRGHAVCTTGPYRIVRHPGNLGMIVGAAGLPLLFQSTWSLAPAALFVASVVVRTQLEDALLTRELAGYRDYRRDVRFRLVPGLW